MQISARNLLHWAKKEAISAQTINAYILENPNTERRIGSLPYEWVQNVDRTERSFITEQIHKIFENFSAHISQIETKMEFEPELNKLLKAIKRILPKLNIDIEYVDSGQLKNCFKISVGDKSYALSTFKRHLTVMDGYFEPAHGRGHEPQMLFTAYKRGSQGRYAKPFMAKVSSENDEGGYILSKFIEENHPQKRDKSDLLRSREYIINGDTKLENLGEYYPYNTINGICIEAGGISDNSSRYISNPQVRRTWYNLVNKLNSEVELMSKGIKINGKLVDMQKISDYLLQLKNKGIDLCTPDSRSILKELSPEEQKAAIKYIRILKKTRILKNKLIQLGQFEKYQAMLNEDLRLNFKLQNSSREYSFSRLTDIKKFPQLIADELGINNIPSIEIIFSCVDRGTIKEKALTDLYTESQLRDHIINNYDAYSVERSPSIRYLSKIFDLSKERQLLELLSKLNYYKAELDNYDTPSFFEPMYSKDKLIAIITHLKKSINEIQKSTT